MVFVQCPRLSLYGSGLQIQIGPLSLHFPFFFFFFFFFLHYNPKHHRSPSPGIPPYHRSLFLYFHTLSLNSRRFKSPLLLLWRDVRRRHDHQRAEIPHMQQLIERRDHIQHALLRRLVLRHRRAELFLLDERLPDSFLPRSGLNSHLLCDVCDGHTPPFVLRERRQVATRSLF